ncbi:MAG TPA: TlpA disulfide reductase family protein [Acidimicrobiales bacterium]|nr:TlpA disulfide reductase family protein [Acidimicrobiales bacterium]
MTIGTGTGVVAEGTAGDAPSPGGDGPVRARHTARWVGVFVLVIGAGLIAVLASRPPAVVVEAQNPVVGLQAPAVAGVTLDGTRYVLPRVPGKFVVLNFFASWCEPCQTEGPNLVQFQFEHQRAGDATMLSVVFDDTESAARNYQESLGVTWPTLADPGGGLALSFGVRAPPTTFVIAPDGRVAAAIVAPVTAADLDQIIAKAKATHA